MRLRIDAQRRRACRPMPPAMRISSSVPTTRSQSRSSGATTALTAVGGHVARRAVAVAREAPEHRAVVDVEDHLARPRRARPRSPSRRRRAARPATGACRRPAARRSAPMNAGVDVRGAPAPCRRSGRDRRCAGSRRARGCARNTSAVRRLGSVRDLRDVHALARQRRAHEVAVLLVAHARDHRRPDARGAKRPPPCSPASRRGTWRTSTRPPAGSRPARHRDPPPRARCRPARKSGSGSKCRCTACEIFDPDPDFGGLAAVGELVADAHHQRLREAEGLDQRAERAGRCGRRGRRRRWRCDAAGSPRCR